MLITKVKAGAVSSLSDARFFAGMGVDWLGFDVDPSSESFASLELYKSIVGWVSGPKRVIEIPRQLDPPAISKLIEGYQPEVIEVDLNELEKFNHDLPIFVRAYLSDVTIEKITSRVSCVVLSADANLSKQVDLVKRIAARTAILLSIAPDMPDLKKILAELPITGIALRGSKEIQTGIKEYDYSDLLESLETE